MNQIARRWGDDDRYIGPLTIARDGRYRHTGMILESANDDGRGANLRISGLGWTFILALPNWLIRPSRQFRPFIGEKPKWATSDGWYEVHQREYGWTYGDGHVSFHYGRQTMDSSTEQRWGFFLPWTQWRHVRRTLYRPDGRLFHDFYDRPRRGNGLRDWQEEFAIEERCPTVSFAFLDYDGQPITAACRIEEREWRWGTRRLPWRLLSLFRKPRIKRSLMLSFSAETGSRKGSWKGGTIGASIELRRVGKEWDWVGGLEYEDQATAFQRYCDENGMTFVREPHLFERYGLTEKPENWNSEVLGWFHRGPELRDKQADGFAEAFHEAVRSHDSTSAVDD